MLLFKNWLTITLLLGCDLPSSPHPLGVSRNDRYTLPERDALRNPYVLRKLLRMQGALNPKAYITPVS